MFSKGITEQGILAQTKCYNQIIDQSYRKKLLSTYIKF